MGRYLEGFKNDSKQKFTWRKLLPDQKQARLGLSVVCEDMFAVVSDSNIVPTYRTDHSALL